MTGTNGFPPYLIRHIQALDCPQGFEEPIVLISRALRLYAEQHAERYESPIGADYVLGDHWKDIARGLIGLLNGETGRLDCGTIDGAIRDLAGCNGMDLDSED